MKEEHRFLSIRHIWYSIAEFRSPLKLFASIIFLMIKMSLVWFRIIKKLSTREIANSFTSSTSQQERDSVIVSKIPINHWNFWKWIIRWQRAMERWGERSQKGWSRRKSDRREKLLLYPCFDLIILISWEWDKKRMTTQWPYNDHHMTIK